MKTDILENTDTYRVVSYNDGFAYLIEDKTKDKGAFMQGDEAILFGGDYYEMQRLYRDDQSEWFTRSWNDCLKHLYEIWI